MKRTLQGVTRGACAILGAFLLTVSAKAQVEFDVTFVDASPPTPLSFFGTSLLAVDVDGDGFCDLIVGEPNADVNGVLDSGRAWILYGPDFQRRKELARNPVKQEFLATKRGVFGDFDGDGHSDIVLLAPTAKDPDLPEFGTFGRARLFFGPDFDEQMVIEDPTPQFGSTLFGWNAVVVDHPLTGQQELLISAHNAWISPDGVTGWFIGEVIAWPNGPHASGVVIENPDPVRSSQFGTGLLVADLDGDGQPELLAGRPGKGPQGDVVVLDAVTKQPLWTIQAPPSTPEYGPVLSFGFLHFAGDLSGDGSVSLVVGAPRTWIGSIPFPGVLFVLGGPDFSIVEHAILPSQPGQDGNYGEKAFVSDVDADGFLDLVVPTMGNPFTLLDNVVDIHFGPDFTHVETLHITATSYASEATAGDFDGDGTLEIAVTASIGNGSGRVYIYDRRSLSADVDAISLSSRTPVGLALDFGVPGANRNYLIALSLSGSAPGLIVAPGSFLPLNADPTTLAGFALIHTTALAGFWGTLDAEGRASATLSLPAGASAALIGHQLTLAAMALAPENRPGFGSSAVTLPIEP